MNGRHILGLENGTGYGKIRYVFKKMPIGLYNED